MAHLQSSAGPASFRGNPHWTNNELRFHLDQAHNSAVEKWGAYLSDLSLSYNDAYRNVANTLDNIKALKKSRQEQVALFWSLILPAVAGGFLGGVVSLHMKAIADKAGTVKFLSTNVKIDTTKTVVSDVAKYTTKQIGAAYQEAVDANPWKPTATDPAKFGETLKNELLHFKVGISDALIASQKPHSSIKYKDLMFILYNSPFIWNAPEEKELAKWKGELWRPLEVFLWADWANHQDTKYWLRRIMNVADAETIARSKRMGYENSMKAEYERELIDLDQILDRLVTKCRVPPEYVTQLMPNYATKWIPRSANIKVGDRPFLNVLWVRDLAGRYQHTLLGELLTRLQNGKAPADLTVRPGAYRLM